MDRSLRRLLADITAGRASAIRSAASSPTSSPAVRYWNRARQRYHRLSARYSHARVSLPTQAACPGPDNRGKPRLLDLERRILARDRFAPDSLLEGSGFELSVPRAITAVRVTSACSIPHRGTDGSQPRRWSKRGSNPRSHRPSLSPTEIPESWKRQSRKELSVVRRGWLFEPNPTRGATRSCKPRLGSLEMQILPELISWLSCDVWIDRTLTSRSQLLAFGFSPYDPTRSSMYRACAHA
jgi:hypothetical protein